MVLNEKTTASVPIAQPVNVAPQLPVHQAAALPSIALVSAGISSQHLQSLPHHLQQSQQPSAQLSPQHTPLQPFSAMDLLFDAFYGPLGTSLRGMGYEDLQQASLWDTTNTFSSQSVLVPMLPAYFSTEHFDLPPLDNMHQS